MAVVEPTSDFNEKIVAKCRIDGNTNIVSNLLANPNNTRVSVKKEHRINKCEPAVKITWIEEESVLKLEIPVKTTAK